MQLSANVNYKRLTVNSHRILLILSHGLRTPISGKGLSISCPNMRHAKLNCRGLLLVVAGSTAALTPSVLGQGSAAPAGPAALTVTTDVKVPAFNLVSIKPNKSASSMVRVMFRPDGYSATNVSLKMLILGAYGVKEDQISGAPGWADIDAKVAGPDVPDLQRMTNDERRLLLQPLLADRFKLTAHNETKVLPIYELIIARNGSQLKEAAPGAPMSTRSKAPMAQHERHADDEARPTYRAENPYGRTDQPVVPATSPHSCGQDRAHGKVRFNIAVGRRAQIQCSMGRRCPPRVGPAPDTSGL